MNDPTIIAVYLLIGLLGGLIIAFITNLTSLKNEISKLKEELAGSWNRHHETALLYNALVNKLMTLQRWDWSEEDKTYKFNPKGEMVSFDEIREIIHEMLYLD
jgi:hypothetical protein